jgi:DNA-binding transcriptional LysR family regulator
MELYHLRSFVAVAEEGNLSRAAARLYLSQPALSAHVKALEDELGVALFLRTPRGMSLTPDGAALKATAEAALAGADAVAEQARALRSTLSGAARIGLNTDPHYLRSAALMNVLMVRHPDLEIHFANRNSGHLLEDLRRGALDGTFVFGEIPFPEVAALDLGRVRVRIAGPVAWKPRLERAGLKDLAEMPWIGIPDHCPYCAILFAMLREHGIPLPTFGMADSEFVLLAMAAAGQGLCVTREDQGLDAAARGEVCLWPGEAFTLPFAFAHVKARAEDRLVAALLAAVREIFADRLPSARADEKCPAPVSRDRARATTP